MLCDNSAANANFFTYSCDIKSFFDPYFNWYSFITHLPSTTSNFKYKKKKNQVLAGHFDPEKVKEEKKKIFC